ncbi:MAG: hypothetical protein ACYDDV_04235 [Methanoregula sp.]
MRGKILYPAIAAGTLFKICFLVPAFQISRIFLIGSPVIFNGTPDNPFYIPRMTIIE